MHCCFTFSVVRTYTSGFELYQDKKPNTNKVSMGSSSGGNQTPRCGRKKKRISKFLTIYCVKDVCFQVGFFLNKIILSSGAEAA